MGAPFIVYLHGFNSTSGSAKGQLVARAAAALPNPPSFYLPDLGHRPSEAMRDVRAMIDAQAGGHDLTLIGSSLGGYYVTWLAEQYEARAIVINPTTKPCADLSAFVGHQRNPYTGEEYDFTRSDLDELAALTVTRITRPQRYFLLVRTGDELLDWRLAIAFYAGAHQYVAGGGDHGWVDFADEVPSVLRFAGCST
jgi:predicted esterase YcpF (UPF0227 family)